MSSLAKSRLDLTLGRMSVYLPFIAAVAMSMQCIVEKCGTAKTNGRWVKFDPDFIEPMSDAELMFLYAHETLHKALLHIWRRGMRDPKLWWYACDYVINLTLVQMKSASLVMPKSGGLIDFRFTGMSEEQVYDILLAEGFKPPEGTESDLDETDAGSMANAEVEIINIAKACQMAGIKNGMIDVILKNAGKSKVRWQDALRAFVNSTVRSGSTWRRRSRRSEDIYLPTLRDKVIQSIVIFGDVSGSMVPLLNAITAEMQGIIDDVGPEQTHVICGDTRVTFVETFERGTRIALRTRGGGGTDFRPLFDEVSKRGWTPACGIFLTDTYGTFPDNPPDYPVIWGVLGADNVRVPWGELVMVKK